MTKAKLVEELASRTGMTKTQAAEIVKELLNIISEALKNGDEVNLPGFGKFYASSRAERKGRDPQTGKTIVIPARRLPSFRAGVVFKRLLAE